MTFLLYYQTMNEEQRVCDDGINRLQIIILLFFVFPNSRQFGFLKLNASEQSKKKALVVRAIKYLERMLVQAQAQKQRRRADSTNAKTNSEESGKDDNDEKGISIDPKTYCKLGHFHLLLEDYSKGSSSKAFSFILYLFPA